MSETNNELENITEESTETKSKKKKGSNPNLDKYSTKEREQSIQDFRRLSAADKLAMVNQRLSVESRSSEFPCDEMKFSYTLALDEMKKIGAERSGDTFRIAFTMEEMEAIRELLKLKNWVIKGSSLGAAINDHSGISAKTTTVRVYQDTWNKWSEFCKRHSDFNSTALLDAAISEFMENYKYR